MYTETANAKINLFLEVVRKRPDGFHDIDSVFAEVDLADRVEVEQTDDDRIDLDVIGGQDIPAGRENIAYRAAEALRDRCGIRTGLRLRLYKTIPMGAGLGGGSSDAAAVLRAANRCWNAGLSPGELAEIGAGLGSDVPFFLYGGICTCQGRGELVTPVQTARVRDVRVGIVLTGIHCETAAAYRGIRLPEPGREIRSEAFSQALAMGDSGALAKTAFNRFEPTIFSAYQELGRLHADLETRLNRPVRLSGSGGSLWFFARPGEEVALRRELDDITFCFSEIGGRSALQDR